MGYRSACLRLAVLLCGVLSGVIALGFGWWGQADALLHVSGLSDAVRLAVILAIQPIALASIAGGAAILVFPAISRAALLASAVGWLGLVAILGGGMSLPVGGLILLSAAGGLLGFVPSLREPMFRLQRAGVRGDEAEPPRPRSSAALRYDLRDAVSQRAAPPSQQQWPQQQPQPAPVYQTPPQPMQQAPQAMPPQPVPMPPPIAPVQAPPQPPTEPPRLTFSSFETMDGPAALPQQPPVPQAPPPPQPPQPPPVQPDALPTLGNVMPPPVNDAGWQAYFPPPDLATPIPTKPPEIRPAVFVP